MLESDLAEVITEKYLNASAQADEQTTPGGTNQSAARAERQTGSPPLNLEV
jgi:hypothetical protein